MFYFREKFSLGVRLLRMASHPPGLHLAQWEADISSIPTCGEKAVDVRAHTTFSSFKGFKEEPDAWLAVGKPVRS